MRLRVVEMDVLDGTVVRVSFTHFAAAVYDWIEQHAVAISQLAGKCFEFVVVDVVDV